MTPSQTTFCLTLERHYRSLFVTDPTTYALARAKHGADGLASKMTLGLATGQANKDGDGIKRTCKELGIKHTYKAIEEYLK